MLDFLKRFGLGILYVVATPFLLVFLLIWMIYNLVIFTIEMIKGLKNFFHGTNFFPEFEEDIEAQRILNANAPIIEPPAATPITQPTNIVKEDSADE